ncbi:hypothetical protein BU15DRAFT_61389 [Melanogaster broomeanus]|nr:hypothetical protein BU15DRAFT_61389 [Melanogaster broomeanus]
MMLAITKIANVETTTVIWEFDPALPRNRVLGDSLDIIAAVRTLTIKIQCSGQRIEYFQTLQAKCSIDPPLVIPLHSNIQWGIVDGMLGHSFELHQDANDIQQYFSDEKQPTLWCAIAALEELQTAWESKGENPKYALYKGVIHSGLGKIAKYYNRLDDKPVYILFYTHTINSTTSRWHGVVLKSKRRRSLPAILMPRIGYDEALKTVENTVQEYWKDGEASNGDKTTNAAVASSASRNPAPETLESEYDRHWRLLLEQASRKPDLGWSAELRHYLNDLPGGVSKDMNIVSV